MDKFKNEKGQVAILYSPGYGAGWSTWGAPTEAIFHTELVRMVLDGRREEIDSEVVRRLFNKDFYTGGNDQLEVYWLYEGERFEIIEYDGYEEVITVEYLKYTA